MIACDVHHVVRVDGSKWCKTKTDNGKQGGEHLVADFDEVGLPLADVNPTDEKEDPGGTPKSDKERVQGDEESDWRSYVFAKGHHTSLESSPSRM